MEGRIGGGVDYVRCKGESMDLLNYGRMDGWDGLTITKNCCCHDVWGEAIH